MEIQLRELLDKIKKDGVESARAEADRIKEAAEADAKAIIAEAEERAKAMLEKAKGDAARFEASAKASVEQAARTLLIAFRESIQATLEAVVVRETRAAFSGDTLAVAVKEAVRALSRDEAFDIALSERDAASIKACFGAKLSEELQDIELKPVASAKSGFRISRRDGSAYYDYSGEAVADMLSRYLNADVAAIMKKAAREA